MADGSRNAPSTDAPSVTSPAPADPADPGPGDPARAAAWEAHLATSTAAGAQVVQRRDDLVRSVGRLTDAVTRILHDHAVPPDSRTPWVFATLRRVTLDTVTTLVPSAPLRRYVIEGATGLSSLGRLRADYTPAAALLVAELQMLDPMPLLGFRGGPPTTGGRFRAFVLRMTPPMLRLSHEFPEAVAQVHGPALLSACAMQYQALEHAVQHFSEHLERVDAFARSGPPVPDASRAAAGAPTSAEPAPRQGRR